MHGRPRNPAKVQDSAASAAKAEKLRALQNQLLYNHHNHIYTKEALEVSSKLLEVNPEVYTAWNYRKLAFQCNLQSSSDPDALKSALNEELRVAEIALRQNPKCYGAWHHRKWVMQREFSLINYDHEFRLLDQLLKADSRNFHGWNHRRFVAALKNIKEEDELQFTTDKINANFSNYSAWHNRSVLLSHLLKHKDPGFIPREKVLTEEFELVHQALFTDPDDQSGWFYYLWLLDQTTSSEDPLLISSWPSKGSDLVFSTNGNADNCMLPFMSFHSDYVPHGENFPIVLCFNQAVKGVNSATVTVQSILNKNEDLNWRPLSTTNSEEACYWVTYLKIPKATCNLSESYPVEVSLGHSLGIISSGGSQYACSSRFGFTLVLNSVGSEHAKEELDMNIFTWKDDNFFTSESRLPESLISWSFEQLRISKDLELASSKWQIETLVNEIALFRELLSEINCKIAKLTLARLLVTHDAIMACGVASILKGTNTNEVLKLYDDLMKLDPSHMRYYKDERSLVLMNQVTSDKESLARHCWHHKEITSSCLHHHVCLRLNKLSLSRIGFVERFLWVHVLDLSQNELQSIEGLEAMQFLSCLNLSKNKISSFTALEPLKLMCSLRVLDISYNEIGSHSIDTTRYLCASPLSHNIEFTWNVKNHGIDSIEGSDYWEAILVLKDLRLAQLDTRGNAISTDIFRTLMVEVLLPTLKWFDGALV